MLSLLTAVMALAAPVGLALATPLGEVVGVRWLFVLMGLVGGIIALMGLVLASPEGSRLGRDGVLICRRRPFRSHCGG